MTLTRPEGSNFILGSHDVCYFTEHLPRGTDNTRVNLLPGAVLYLGELNAAPLD